MKKGFITLLIAIPVLFIAATVSNEKYFLIAKNLDIFATLFKEVNAHYVDEVDPSDLVKTGIDAMLGSLDPYTDFIPEDERDAFRTMTTGQYAGIGILVGNINDQIRVTRVYEGFAAHRAGIKVGDVITSIGNQSLNPGMISSVGELLRGLPSSRVRIVLKRPPAYEVVEVEVDRENIRLNNVTVKSMVNETTGYIKLEEFTTGAAREVKSALVELEKQGARSLILDLRGNGGGLLTEAANICNIFIDKGLEIVSTKGRIKEWNKTYKALSSPTDTDIPLVVLVDGGSASASEVVAGVIQDYDRGVLIGSRTFGKGLVQTTRPLSYDAQLKVTTAKYYIPSGRCIQEIDYAAEDDEKVQEQDRIAYKTRNGRVIYDGSGLKPDIEVKPPTYSAITRSLAMEGLIFDYAINYHYSHPGIGPARDFSISLDSYKDFVDWMGTREFEYQTTLESKLDEIIATAKEEQYFDSLEDEIDAFRSTIARNKANDLLNFRDEISLLLTREIAGTYYNYTGEVESTFSGDGDIAAAINVLNSQDQYRSILGF